MSSARSGRSRQSTLTLLGALGASLGIVLILVLITVRPANTQRGDVDWHTVHDQTVSDTVLADPTFTEADGDWWSNRAELVGGKYPEWYIGLISPTQGFVVLEQFTGDPSPEIAGELDDVTPSSVTIDGESWTFFDRSSVDNAGNRELIFLLTGLPGNGSLMVSGTAPRDEIELVATRAAESLKGTP